MKLFSFKTKVYLKHAAKSMSKDIKRAKRRNKFFGKKRCTKRYINECSNTFTSFINDLIDNK